MKFTYHPTPHFKHKLDKIARHDPPGFQRVKAVIERILLNPDDADGRMRGLHHGRLKKYVGRKDYRIIYKWCEICRKVREHLENPCGNCDHLEDHSVVFFDLYHKNEAAELKHST